MRKILVRVLAVGLLLSSFLFYHALAQEAKLTVTAHNAVILFLQGDVKIKQAGFGEWLHASEGMALYPGDTVKTGAGSWVEIGVGSSQANVMKVKESTVLELTDLGPVEINLLKGELRTLVEKLDEGETFEVKTPMSVCGVRGTGWDTSTDGKQAVADVYENSVYFSGLARADGMILGITLNAGKRGVLEGPAEPIILKDVPLDKMNDWKKWKNDFMQRRGSGVGKLPEKVEDAGQQQKAAQNMMKGKQGVFEKGDKLIMDNRTSTSESRGSP